MGLRRLGFRGRLLGSGRIHRLFVTGLSQCLLQQAERIADE
ncbi:MAG TPA: hypothetical protein VN674_08350 [Gemmatimonadales bacterium]|nr:hypothetical protein [Gemmatimonadales bacterium]